MNKRLLATKKRNEMQKILNENKTEVQVTKVFLDLQKLWDYDSK